MLIDRTHIRWLVVSLICLVIATAAYMMAHEASPEGVRGGSLPGLMFGLVGSAFMIFAGLLAGRRKFRSLRLGNARFWMRGHLWLGMLSVPLILFHSGFQIGGLLEQLLWLSFALVVFSGIAGLFLQQTIPRVLGTTVDHETVSNPEFVARRLTLMADMHVAEAWGKLPLDSNEFAPLIQRINQVPNFKKIRELEGFPTDDVDLLNKVWSGLGESGYLKLPQEKKCPAFLAAAYESDSSEKDLKTVAEPNTGKSTPTASKKKSPLELAREQAAGKSSVGSDEAKPASKKKSPLELAREQAAGKSLVGSDEAKPASKKKSPLELAREQAAGKSSVGSDEAKPASKKKSPLELAREQSGKPSEPKRTAPKVASVARRTSPPKRSKSTQEQEEDEIKQYVKGLYVRHLRPYLNHRGKASHAHRLETISEQVLHRMASLVDNPRSNDAIAAIRDLHSERRQFDMQVRMQAWLQGWLIVHIPFTVILGVFFVVHVFVALKVVPPFMS